MRLRLVLTLCLAVFAATALGQEKKTDLQTYLERSFPRCPGGAVQVEQIQTQGPHGFVPYRVRFTSSETACGRETFALFSPASGQVIVADLFPLPADGRPVEARLGEVLQRVLKQPVRVTVNTTILEDGLREVAMTRDLKEGPFDFHGYLDASQSFLMVGRRGKLKVDPRKDLQAFLSSYSPFQRGKPDAPIRIVELSDFQCPTCKAAHDMLEETIQKNLGRISYSRIDLPIFEGHDWSLNAAMAARAIQRISPQHYWQFVDHIFDNQSLIKRSNFDVFIQDFVEANEIDAKKFNAIYQSTTERKAVIDQVERLFDIGIFATPTYIVNGQEIFYGPGGAHVKQYLENLLKEPVAKSAISSQ